MHTQAHAHTHTHTHSKLNMLASVHVHTPLVCWPPYNLDTHSWKQEGIGHILETVERDDVNKVV